MIKQKNSEKTPSLLAGQLTNQGIGLGSYGLEVNNCSLLQQEVISQNTVISPISNINTSLVNNLNF